MIRETPIQSREYLLTEGWLRAADEPVVAASLLAQAAFASLSLADHKGALEAAQDAVRLAEKVDAGVPAFVDLAHGIALLFTDSAAAADVLSRALETLEAHEPQAPWGPWCHAGSALLWCDRYDAAANVLERVVRHARMAGALEPLPLALDTLASVEFRTGHWRRADGHSAEALRIARALGHRFQTASCLTTLARLAAVRGLEGKCRMLLADASEHLDFDAFAAGYVRSAAALLELSLGNPAAAAKELEQLRREEGEAVFDNPTIFQADADLVEAYVRARRRREADEALARFAESATRSGRASALAAHARCSGLTASTAGFDLWFEHALELHEQLPTPFERARTLLCYGERLRRARRPREARARLEEAIAIFDRLGAAPWGERARRELESRRRKAGSSELLTPHEQQVVALVGRGATNREAADRLFVSEKTIEYHLASIYRKLGVRSRSQLAYAFGSRGE